MRRIIAIILLLVSAFAQAQQPSLKGGLTNFVKRNIIYPPYSLHNCIQGTVNVGFKLNEKGEVYYTTINKGIGTDLDDEALRLVRMSTGKWTVPIGHDTTALLVVPVNFKLDGYDCRLMSQNDIALAVKAYKDEQELINVVLNFYRNKEKGNYKPEDLPKISRIKSELGIDEDYLENRINAGLRKYKQGDKLGACEEFNFVKYMGSKKADEQLAKYCK